MLVLFTFIHPIVSLFLLLESFKFGVSFFDSLYVFISFISSFVSKFSLFQVIIFIVLKESSSIKTITSSMFIILIIDIAITFIPFAF